MALVYISVGSNLGNRIENCREALRLLTEAGIPVVSRSPLHETLPWGTEGQPRFINLAVAARTDKEPSDLLKALKKIERQLGRKETFRWGPRVIDLDILFYDSLVITGPALTIPHPHLHEREFVLKPLSEIAPDAVHPVLRKRVRDLLSAITEANDPANNRQQQAPQRRK